MDYTISSVLQWISNKGKGMTKQHLEGIGAASVVIFTCLYIKFLYRVREARRRKKNVRAFHRSMTLGALHGGRKAMERILEAQHARIDASVLDGAEVELKILLLHNSLDFNRLQSAARKLEMSGKENEALDLLNEALKNAEKKGDVHEAYELGMLIVEMLIYKGDYIGALDHPCLQHQEITDARRPLYKTVIQIMLGHKTVAKEMWDEFQEIRSQFYWPDSFHDGPIHSVSQDFDKFQNAVMLLKEEIERAHQKKPN